MQIGACPVPKLLNSVTGMISYARANEGEYIFAKLNDKVCCAVQLDFDRNVKRLHLPLQHCSWLEKHAASIILQASSSHTRKLGNQCLALVSLAHMWIGVAETVL